MLRAVLAAGLLGTLGTPGTPVPGPPVRAAATVDYQGLRISVPRGWQVKRIGRGSTECVRYDKNVIYLGPAGKDQMCDTRASGRTETLHVEPLDDQTSAFVSSLLGSDHARGRVDLGGLAGIRVNDAVSGEERIAVPDVGALITGSYGSDPSALDRVLRGVRPARTGGDWASTTPDADRPAWVNGHGFDTCHAPSLAAMRAWRKSFVAANIYIGGAARACPDGNLSPSWINAVRDMGWRLIPTYVGRQAPCTAHKRVRFSAANAAAEGRREAVNAVARADALGIPPHAPIYYDLESYDRHNTACRRAVLTFLDAWTKKLKKLKYISGVYSSIGSGIRDLSNATGIKKPTAIWFAHWDGQAGVRGDRFVSDSQWTGHRRIKQYRGGHRERHGGVTLYIDSDFVDGPVH